MSAFFNSCLEYNLIKVYAPIFDWLFDDKRRFDKRYWGKDEKKRYSKAIKRVGEFKEANYVPNPKGLKYPKDNSRRKEPCAFFTCSESQGEALLRHIRNAIAHGNSAIYTLHGRQYIRLLDFSNNDHKKQTAFIAVPTVFLRDMYQEYVSIEKSSKNKFGRH